MEGEEVADTVRQTVFLMRVGHPEIDIEPTSGTNRCVPSLIGG